MKLKFITKYLQLAGLLLGVNAYSQRTYDNSLLLKASALVPVTADGSLVLDVGNGLLDADLILDVTVAETVADGSSIIVLEGSPDAAFGVAGNIAALARIAIGKSAAAALAPQGFDDVIGRYMVPFRNERNGTTYRYLRIRTIVAGTAPTGLNYMAWVAKDQ